MFTGTLTKAANASAVFTGTIHSAKFDIAIQLEARNKMSEASPDYDITAKNRSGAQSVSGPPGHRKANRPSNPTSQCRWMLGLVHSV